MTVLSTQLLFRAGISVGVHHWWLIPSLFLLVLWSFNFVSKFRDVCGSVWESACFLLFLIFSIWVSQWVVGTDFDGLFMHVEFIRALTEGWNPSLDPKFNQHELLEGVRNLEFLKTKLDNGGYYLKYGQILEAVIASRFGMEAGKAISWLFLYFLFRSLVFLLDLWTGDRKKALFFSAMISMNPVILYQLPSFMHDGMVGCLLSVMIIGGIVILKELRISILIIYGISMAMLIGVKKSGLAYSGFLTGLFLLFFCIQNRRFILKRFPVFLSGLLGFAAIVFLILKTGLWDIRPMIQLPIVDTLKNRGSLVEKIKPITVFDDHPEYRNMDGLEQFLTTSFSRTNINVQHPQWKLPGQISKREIQNLYEAFTGYWIGGMGPLFSLALVASLLGTVLGLFCAPNAWKWMIYLVIPVIVSVSFLPSLCVRWVPHIWLLCFVWVFIQKDPLHTNRKPYSVFSLRHLKHLRNAAVFVAASAVIVNSLLIVTMTIAGQYRIRNILDCQFEILEQIPAPLEISVDWFPSNRFWLEDRGLEYQINQTKMGRKKVPFTNLYRTNTRVHFPKKQLEFPVTYPRSGEIVSLEEALLKLEAEQPKDVYSWPWVRPFLQKKRIRNPRSA